MEYQTHGGLVPPPEQQVNTSLCWDLRNKRYKAAVRRVTSNIMAVTSLN